MTEIQQYRKDSAEWMKIKLDKSGRAYRIDKTKDERYQYWHPDQDHNQMVMIEDKLIDEERLDITQYCSLIWGKNGEWLKQYSCEFEQSHNGERVGYGADGQDKLTAFRQAWTEYYKANK